MIYLYLICSIGGTYKHQLVSTTFLWQDSETEYWTIWNPWKVFSGLPKTLARVSEFHNENGLSNKSNRAINTLNTMYIR